ncbi:hypothetical protein PPYR_02010 [Photinus pyralis]|uniref:Uncharacterized protein n=1 Tax=Photinus pyralis TaxID=7054 RepID=A0A5N4B6P9_PHOPY|nr:uncharacterized protein LOC116159066 isoform X2 [Photinus pyralis]XP_031347494.1 uncharacterized protein LOC116173894 isoform X2 [Photinus pyralis]KAB0805040.1 hypothetical protein PPYR_02010 [Photinus pyralis]
MFQVVFMVCFCLNLAYTISPCGTSCPTNTSAYYELGYYWRDYFGVVPYDAFPGGQGESGHQTYIGQVYSTNYELLPGTIYNGCHQLRTSARDKELIFEKNMKILATDHSAKLKWIPTKRDSHHLLTDCHLVVGGAEGGATVNIGRINFNGQTIVGTTFPDKVPNNGLWIPGRNTSFDSYEILTYNC